MRLRDQPEYRGPMLAIDGITGTKQRIGLLRGENIGIIAVDADKKGSLSRKFRKLVAFFRNRCATQIHPNVPRARLTRQPYGYQVINS